MATLFAILQSLPPEAFTTGLAISLWLRMEHRLTRLEKNVARWKR